MILAGNDFEFDYSIVVDQDLQVTGTGGKIRNCTIYNGTLNIDENCDVYNTIVFNRSGDDINIAAGRTVTGRNNCFGDAAKAGTGTYTDQGASTLWGTDPSFAASAPENPQLLFHSPCRNAGNNSVWSGAASITDYDGNAITDADGNIVAVNGVDMGALEWTDALQTQVIASSYKKASWLFKVVDNEGSLLTEDGDQIITEAAEVLLAEQTTTHYWSTIARDFGGDSYVFKVIPSSFQGVTLNRAKSEIGIQAPNDLSFDASNSDNALTASYFVGGSVTLYLSVSDGTDEETVNIWKFNIKQCESVYQKLHFVCEDFIQKYLRGDYPNTKLVKDISYSTDTDINNNICVPVPFGTPYIPLRSLYITDQRYYLLGLDNGLSGVTSYTVNKVRSPRAWGGKSEWSGGLLLTEKGDWITTEAAEPLISERGDYAFTQTTKTISGVTWAVFQPIIADSDGDGIVDANGLWKQGEYFLDMPTQFQRWDKHNQCLWSEEFNNAAWVKVRSNVTANDTTAPDGTVTADKFYLDNTNDTNHLIYQDIAEENFTDDADATFSVYAKADEIDWIRIVFNDKRGSSTYSLAYFDLTNGVIGWIAVGSTASISAAANGFYRCSVTANVGSGSNVPRFIIYHAEGDRDHTFAVGDGTSGFYIWGAQVEEASTAWDYMRTSDTVAGDSITKPEEVIEYVFEDMGVASGDINTGTVSSFETSGTTYASWGLEFQGAYFYKQPRPKVISSLLTMCHSTLRVTDKIELKVLQKTSQKTITKADITRPREVGEGTFRYNLVTQKQSDSGYIAFQEGGESQDEFLKALVPAKSTTNDISGEILEVQFVQDSQNAQRIGTLYYQRKLLRKANISFTGKGTLLALEPDDVVTVNDADYGGSYDILVDSMGIKRDLSIDFQCTQFSEDLDDWDDLTPSAITFVTDDSGSYWTPVISGPDGKTSVGAAPNILQGKVIINTADGIEVQDGGNINLLAGGDIVLTPSDTNPSIIKFSTIYNIGAASTQASGLCIWPTATGSTYFRIGYSPITLSILAFNYVQLIGQTSVLLYVEAGSQINVTENSIAFTAIADPFYTFDMSTEDLEFHDAGSAGATQQDWIKVEVGGNVGYIHVYAAV